MQRIYQPRNTATMSVSLLALRKASPASLAAVFKSSCSAMVNEICEMQEEARASAAAEHQATVTLQRDLSPEFCRTAIQATQLALQHETLEDGFIVARGLLALAAASPTAAAQLARHGVLAELLSVRPYGFAAPDEVTNRT